METLNSHLPLKTARFSIEKYHYENIGLTERMISMFLSGVLVTRGIRKPLKGQFLYGIYMAYRGLTGHCIFLEQLGIDAHKPKAVNIRGSFEIDKPAAEVYAYWRNLNDLPARLKNLLNIEIKDDKHSHWKAEALGAIFLLDWDAEIVHDEPGQMIGWRSQQPALLRHVGRIQFEESKDGKATIMKIVLSYHPPMGSLGMGIAKLMSPYLENQLKKEIRNFKFSIENVSSVQRLSEPPLIV